MNEFKFNDKHKKTVSKAKYLRFPTLARSAPVKLNKSLLTHVHTYTTTVPLHCTGWRTGFNATRVAARARSSHVRTNSACDMQAENFAYAIIMVRIAVHMVMHFELNLYLPLAPSNVCQNKRQHNNTIFVDD